MAVNMSTQNCTFGEPNLCEEIAMHRGFPVAVDTQLPRPNGPPTVQGPSILRAQTPCQLQLVPPSDATLPAALSAVCVFPDQQNND